MNWSRVAVGLLASTVGGAAVLYLVIDLILWGRFYKDSHEVKNPRRRFTLTILVGALERLLYTLSICIGAWEWVGIWIAVKVAVRWRSDKSPEGKVDNIWLIGMALSVLCGYLCAWFILGKLPTRVTCP
jgi:hypothetical protein